MIKVLVDVFIKGIVFDVSMWLKLIVICMVDEFFFVFDKCEVDCLSESIDFDLRNLFVFVWWGLG